MFNKKNGQTHLVRCSSCGKTWDDEPPDTISVLDGEVLSAEAVQQIFAGVGAKDPRALENYARLEGGCPNCHCTLFEDEEIALPRTLVDEWEEPADESLTWCWRLYSCGGDHAMEFAYGPVRPLRWSSAHNTHSEVTLTSALARRVQSLARQRSNTAP
jgi:hypothetical protein